MGKKDGNYGREYYSLLKFLKNKGLPTSSQHGVTYQKPLKIAEKVQSSCFPLMGCKARQDSNPCGVGRNRNGDPQEFL